MLATTVRADDAAQAALQGCVGADTVSDLVAHVSAEIRQSDGTLLHQGEYQRYWLQGDPAGKFSRRAILFVEEPGAYRNVAYLSWRYVENAGRLPEAWVYVPRSQNARRATAKDPDDRWWRSVDTDLDYSPTWDPDATVRAQPGDDESGGERVEIVPDVVKDYASLLLTIQRDASSGSCVIKAVEYLDAKRRRIRAVTMSWHRMDGVWYRNMVSIEDAKGRRQATYLLSRTRVNVGLRGEDFTPQRLRVRPEVAPPGGEFLK